jgi:2-(1,2-epoxy-1,2-dihydrophenyl)acetyl-CoA isomerase
MDFETILLTKQDHIATITLNRPEILNAANIEMFQELLVALEDIERDDNIRVMVLTGAGRAFCASADLKAEGAEVGKRNLSHMTIDEVRQMVRSYPQKVTLAIRNMEKPTIAMINGLAIGDGFDWCLACDIRIAVEDARFMNAFIKIGFSPITGATWFYPRVMPLGKALAMLYTGDWLTAAEAHKLGILYDLVPADELSETTMALATRIAQAPPLAVRQTKLLTYRALDTDFESALESAADGAAMMITTQDHIEAVSAWLEKREPRFTGK